MSKNSPGYKSITVDLVTAFPKGCEVSEFEDLRSLFGTMPFQSDALKTMWEYANSKDSVISEEDRSRLTQELYNQFRNERLSGANIEQVKAAFSKDNPKSCFNWPKEIDNTVKEGIRKFSTDFDDEPPILVQLTNALLNNSSKKVIIDFFKKFKDYSESQIEKDIKRKPCFVNNDDGSKVHIAFIGNSDSRGSLSISYLHVNKHDIITSIALQPDYTRPPEVLKNYLKNHIAKQNPEYNSEQISEELNKELKNITYEDKSIKWKKDGEEISIPIEQATIIDQEESIERLKLVAEELHEKFDLPYYVIDSYFFMSQQHFIPRIPISQNYTKGTDGKLDKKNGLMVNSQSIGFTRSKLQSWAISSSSDFSGLHVDKETDEIDGLIDTIKASSEHVPTEENMGLNDLLSIRPRIFKKAEVSIRVSNEQPHFYFKVPDNVNLISKEIGQSNDQPIITPLFEQEAAKPISFGQRLINFFKEIGTKIQDFVQNLFKTNDDHDLSRSDSTTNQPAQSPVIITNEVLSQQSDRDLTSPNANDVDNQTNKLFAATSIEFQKEAARLGQIALADEELGAENPTLSPRTISKSKSPQI